jgi:hypothetical protein
VTQTFYVDPTQGTNGSGTVGSPFNSWYNAWAGTATAFNSATEDYVYIMLAGLDTNAGNSETDRVILDPTTASSTPRALRFIASGANRQTGVRSTGYRLPGFRALWNTDNTNVSLEIIGLSLGGVSVDRTVNVIALVDSCLLADSPEHGVYCGGGTITLRNTAVIASNFEGVKAENNNGTGTITAINVTEAGANNGCTGFLGNITAINCYSADNEGDDWNTSGSRTNCYSEDGTQSTSTAAYSTSTFVSVTGGSENLKLAAASALIGAGVGPGSNGSVPTTDFEGDVRSGATTDVGFDQRAAAGGGISVGWLRAA